MEGYNCRFAYKYQLHTIMPSTLELHGSVLLPQAHAVYLVLFVVILQLIELLVVQLMELM